MSRRGVRIPRQRPRRSRRFADAGRGKLIASAGFKLGTKPASSTTAKLRLSKTASQELQKTGEMPALAVTRLSGRGENEQFAMLRRPIPPTVITGKGARSQYAAFASTQADLIGAVLTHHLETSYYFEYGTTVAYGSKTPVQSAKQPTLVPTATLNNLTPGATYHFRLVASNAGGTGLGADQTFTMATEQRRRPTVEGPTAFFTYAPISGGLFTFTDQSTAGANPLSGWSWDFGDPTSADNTATGATASHTFSQPGAYIVTETVTDQAGSTDTSSQYVTVT